MSISCILIIGNLEIIEHFNVKTKIMCEHGHFMGILTHVISAENVCLS